MPMENTKMRLSARRSYLVVICVGLLAWIVYEYHLDSLWTPGGLGTVPSNQSGTLESINQSLAQEPYMPLVHEEDDGGASNMQAFLEWFDGRGGLRKKITLAKYADMGVGIQATEEIQEQELIMSVPFDLVICRDTLKRIGGADYIVYDKILDDEVLLILFLMKQKALGDRSRWAEYLRVLPEKILSPVTFTSSEQEELQDKYEIENARRRREELRRLFDHHVPSIQKLFRDIYDQRFYRKFSSLSTFLWAKTIVSSRALTMRGMGRFLVPLADMFNYKESPKPRSSDGGNFFLEHHKILDGKFHIYADRHTSKGRQVFEDYGDNNNYIYFRYHGFVPQQNPFDCVEISLPPLSAVDDSAVHKEKILRWLQISWPRRACVNPKTGVLATKDDYYLRVLTMDEKTARQCDARPSREHCEKEGHKASAVRVLLEAAQERDVYPTTIEQDQSLLKDQTSLMTDRERLDRKKALRTLTSTLKRILKEEEEKDEHNAFPAVRSSNSEKDWEKRHSALLERVKIYNEWSKRHFGDVFVSSKLEARVIEDMRVGAFATTDISAESPYVEVRAEGVMSAITARKCKALGPIFRGLREHAAFNDRMTELLLHLMYEKFVRGNESRWFGYLQLLPSLDEMDSPILYSKQDLKKLKGSAVMNAAIAYRERVKMTFRRTKTFIFEEYPKVFSEYLFNEENYLWASLILDTRSIWWDGERHLVPGLDLVNCKIGPNPNRLHSTAPSEQDPSIVVTRAPTGFAAGHQIFENYGQPNHIYFLYHGFVLPNNPNDCLRLDLSIDADQWKKDHPEKDLQRILRGAGFARLEQRFCIKPDNIPRTLLKFLIVKDALSDRNFDQAYERLLVFMKDKRQEYLQNDYGQTSESASIERERIATFMSMERLLVEDIIAATTDILNYQRRTAEL